MPHGGALRIREIMRNEHVKIEFSDTGVGMSRETLEHLFEPFLTSKPDSGYGLGLTVVRWIIQKHSGKLHIYSDGPNKGATVTISLSPMPKKLTKSLVADSTHPGYTTQGCTFYEKPNEILFFSDFLSVFCLTSSSFFSE